MPLRTYSRGQNVEPVTLTIKYTPQGLEVEGPTGNPPLMLWMLESAKHLFMQSVYNKPPAPPPTGIIPASEMMAAGLNGGHPLRR